MILSVITGIIIRQDVKYFRIHINQGFLQKKYREKSQPISRPKIGFQTTSSICSVNSSVKICLFSLDGLKPKLSMLQHRSLFYEVQYQVKSSLAFCGWKYYSCTCIFLKEQNESSYAQHKRTIELRLHSFQVKRLNWVSPIKHLDLHFQLDEQ